MLSKSYFLGILMSFFNLITFALSCRSQEIVLEAEKAKPEWVNSVESGFLIVSARGSSIEDAKVNALSALKYQIASSVAVNIQSTITSNQKETITEGEVKFSENTNHEIVENTINLPFLQKISLNKAVDSYWERITTEISNQSSWVFYVKYPYSSLEMQELAAEFRNYDKTMNHRLDSIAIRYNYIQSVEEIEDCIRSLKTLKSYFTHNRSEELILIINKFQKLFSSIKIDPIMVKDDLIIYRLLLFNKPLSILTDPKTKSNCALIKKIVTSTDSIKIEFDSSECTKDKKNYILVTYIIHSKFIQNKFFLNN